MRPGNWRLVIVGAVLILATPLHSLSTVGAPSHAHVLYFYATQSGNRALDQGDGGGNPFASSLVELLSRPDLTLRAFAGELRERTARKSQGFQTPVVPIGVAAANWRLQPKPKNETRIALVIVFSDYASSGGAPSLPGAKYDADRVGNALVRAGFQTETVIDPTRAELANDLGRFASRSTASEVALIYATGHGVEVDGTIYLLPGDYPIAEGNAKLDQRAVRLSQFAAAMRGKRMNFIFYGGCRDNPLQ